MGRQKGPASLVTLEQVAELKRYRQQKRFYSRKYGIDLARFSHREQNIVHASTKLDDHTVRYHSMHDNKYLSYFRGHTDRQVLFLRFMIHVR